MIVIYPLFQRQYASIKPLPREGTTGESQLGTQIKGTRAQPGLSLVIKRGTSQVHLPRGSALPAPGLLGDVVNEGTTAEAQLITLLGFVVIQSFHGPLRLLGKTRRKRSGRRT